MPDGTYDYTQGLQGFQDIINQILATPEPTPFMEEFYGATGMQPGQIGDYIMKMLSGAPAAEQAAEFEQRGLADVNRIATQMFRRERLRSAATGGRGSSAAAAMRARGGEMLAGRRAGVRGQAATLEQELRGQMFGRGMGTLGAWQGATRGDWQQALEYANMLLGTTGPMLGAYGVNLNALIEFLRMEGYLPEAEVE